MKALDVLHEAMYSLSLPPPSRMYNSNHGTFVRFSYGRWDDMLTCKQQLVEYLASNDIPAAVFSSKYAGVKAGNTLELVMR